MADAGVAVGPAGGLSDGTSAGTIPAPSPFASAPAGGSSGSSSSSSSPALIVTSNASRANYANNVSSLGTALGNLSTAATAGAQTRGDANGNVYNVPVTNADGSITYYSGPSSSIPKSSTPAAPAKTSGSIPPANNGSTPPASAPATGGAPAGGNPAPAPTGNNASLTLPAGATGWGTDSTGKQVPVDNSGVIVGAAPQGSQLSGGGFYVAPNGTDRYSMAPGSSVSPASGTTTSPAYNPDGTVTNPDGTVSDPTASLATTNPGLAALFKTQLASFASEISDAKANLASAKALVANDPAAVAAANMIEAQYQVLIQAQTQKNAQVLGRASTAAAAFGGLGPMSLNFMSSEMDRANQAIADLYTKMNAAVLKSNQAYQSGDLKAFNDAQTQVQNMTKDMSTSIGQLLTATQDQVKNVQADTKLQLQETKQQLTTDVTSSAKVASAVLQDIQAAGVTDLSSVDPTIWAEYASAHGINDPSILASAVIAASAAQTKANLANANTQNEIDTRTSNANNNTRRTNNTLAKGNLSAAQKKGAIVTAYQNTMTAGATLSDGTPIVDGNGYITPGAWKEMIASAPSDGLTRSDFIKAFGSKIYSANGIDATQYGLTNAEVKLITGTVTKTNG